MNALLEISRISSPVRRDHRRLAVVLLTLAMSGVVAPAAAAPSFTPLNFSPTATSADGRVVVGTENLQGLRAVRWTADGGAVTIGNGAEASDVSADGAVVVGSVWRLGAQRAFRWNAADGLVEIPHQPRMEGLSKASAVSADGSVIVGTWGDYWYDMYSEPGYEAFRWTSGDGMWLIHEFGLTLGFASQAVDVSADGTVVVGDVYQWSGDGHGPTYPFAYHALGGMVTLPMEGYSAAAVSADGSVVVGNFGRLSSDDGLLALGALPGQDGSWASDVSADGSVVVGTSFAGDLAQSRAFIWDEANGMRSLADVLGDLGIDLGGWRLEQATGISADGRTIVGTGLDPLGQRAGWIATIPEPVALPLLALCALVLRRPATRRPTPGFKRFSFPD